MRNQHCIVCGAKVVSDCHTSYTYCNEHNGQAQVDYEIETFM